MVNRRNFLKKTIAGAVATTISSGMESGLFGRTGNRAGFITDNPYEGIQWDMYQQIASASHVHITSQDKLDKICRNLKLKHIPISNYYPSTPYYPVGKIKRDQFMVGQEFGAIYDLNNTPKDNFRNGKFKEGPLNWNKIIMDPETGWYDKLPDERKLKMPFKENGPLFTNIPDDVIFSPNSEQAIFTNSGLHVCAVGSLFSSGTFDAHNEFLTVDHGYCPGSGRTWETIFTGILDKLLFKDAGGITINHPVWTGLKYEAIIEMLDFDPRVLGIEIYNDLCATGYGDPNKGWAVKFWDQVLTSGRRCLGFFVPDHTVGKGKNILLVPEFNEHECLKAYRKGAFYGMIQDGGLTFTGIRLEQNKLYIDTSRTSTILLITNKGQAMKKAGKTSYEYEIPFNSSGVPDITYVRIEAWDEESNQIYSQPIRFINS